MSILLTNKTLVMYAMKHYDNAHCVDISEFYEDLRRINYIKRLFVRYKTTGELKERMILNHLIILYNVFPIKPLTNMIFLKLNRDLWSLLKTFLVYLNFMPEEITFSGITVRSSEILIDINIANVLREI